MVRSVALVSQLFAYFAWELSICYDFQIVICYWYDQLQ